MTTINTQQLYQFVKKEIGTSLDAREAKSLGLEDEYDAVIGEQELDEVFIDDVLADNDLYAQFATMLVEKQEKEQAAKDKEQEKEEQMQVKDKNNAGV